MTEKQTPILKTLDNFCTDAFHSTLLQLGEKEYFNYFEYSLAKPYSIHVKGNLLQNGPCYLAEKGIIEV